MKRWGEVWSAPPETLDDEDRMVLRVLGERPMPMPEEQIADAILALAPPKIEGGSPPRRAWLNLVISVMSFLADHGYDYKAYRDRLVGATEDETRDVAAVAESLDRYLP